MGATLEPFFHAPSLAWFTCSLFAFWLAGAHGKSVHGKGKSYGVYIPEPSGTVGDAVTVKVLSKTEQFNTAAEGIVPKNIARTLALATKEPAIINTDKQVDIPGELMLQAKAFAERKTEEAEASGALFKDRRIMAVVKAEPADGAPPARLELAAVQYPVYLLSNCVTNTHPIRALSIGAVALTKDGKIVMQVRSDAVAAAKRMRSIPASFMNEPTKREGEPREAESTASEIRLPLMLLANLGRGVKLGEKNVFIGMFEDASLYRNNVVLVYAKKLLHNSEELASHLGTAPYGKKTAAYEFIDNTSGALSHYVKDNFDTLMPPTQLALLAYGYLHYGMGWLEEISQDMRRSAFFGRVFNE